MARKPALQGSDRRQQILEAALDLFAEQGLNGATSKEIAERAEVTHGLIYFYFKTKEELFKAAFEYALEQALARLDVAAIIQSDDPPEQALTQLLARILDALNAPRMRNMSRLMLHTMAHDDWSAGPLHECKLHVRTTIISVVEAVRAYLDRQVELGRLRPVDTETVAKFLVGGVVASVRWARTGGLPDVPPEETARVITDACVRGLLLRPTEEPAPPARADVSPTRSIALADN